MEANKVLNLMFEMKVNTHIIHLQTDSMSEHKTLQQFYECIEPILDEYAEQYMGITGKDISKIGSIQVKEGARIDTYLKECASKLEEYKNSEENFILEDIAGDALKLIYKTLYLLKLT